MDFKKSYPQLFQFFAGYFPDADLEDFTDEQVVSNYILDCNKSEKSKSELENAKKELNVLIENIEDYWQKVGQESNRYFATSADALEWLKMIKQNLG
jgi:hypothetical protein